MPTTPVPVPDTAVEDFADDGATVLRSILTDEWLERLAQGVEYNRTHPSRWSHWYTDEKQAVGFWTDYVTWPDVPAYRDAAFTSPLPVLARAMMRSHSVRFFHEHVLVKEPGATERTPWHHDQPYYCLDGDQTVSLWVPLDPVPASAGMRFIAGSHRWNRWFVPRRFIDHTPYSPGDGRYEIVPDLDAEIAAGKHEVLTFDVDPGDVIAFHFRTLHDAPGNRHSTRRRAVSFRFVGDDAVFAERPWQVSPPYDAGDLVPGGPLGDDHRFPVVHLP